MKHKRIHQLFMVSVLLKGLDGLLETIGGLLMFAARGHTLTTIVDALTAGELSEDPDDLVANTLRHVVHHLSPHTRLFVSAYLVAHGLVKVFLVKYLLENKLWAYPVALWFLGVFVAYQAYRFTLTFSMVLLAATVFDTIVVWLIWREYRWRKRKPTTHNASA